MSEKATDETESKASETPKKVAIERKLPLDAIDIESQKDMHPGRKHSIRTFSDWFAATPTPAAKLSVLGLVLPSKTSQDGLLEITQIRP